MRVTRSATRAAQAIPEPAPTPAIKTAPKRKAISSSAAAKKPRTKASASQAVEDAQEEVKDVPKFEIPPRPGQGNHANDIVPAVLSFSFDDAKKHLIGADLRFERLFNQLTCKPYENLERVHPFQALAQSILGQQISWMAARSIHHRFVRLYNPSLPEKVSDVTEDITDLFPAPEQVAKTDVTILKTAGLSTRKAEYVQDLASRFADGRLSTSKLLQANDEELAEMLIEVRGIGRWTVDMFAIFTLRRPDILPVGDLGVQRGVARWFLDLHSPTYNFSISPDKLAGTQLKETATKTDVDSDDDDALPVPGGADQSSISAADVSSVPPGAIPATPLPDGSRKNVAALPPPLTPSTAKQLTTTSGSGRSLPKSLTAAELKSRLDGKKKIKGALLTPEEMEELTAPWKPYRSLGVYYMWSLADG